MERKQFATQIDTKIIKTLKLLSVHKEKPCNALMEEALRDLFKKHGQKIEK